MPFVDAKCPNCGGEIKLDDNTIKGFCLHCGSQLMVQEVIQRVEIEGEVNVKGVAPVENLIKLLKRQIENGEMGTQAFKDRLNRAIELDPDNVELLSMSNKAGKWSIDLIGLNRLNASKVTRYVKELISSGLLKEAFEIVISQTKLSIDNLSRQEYEKLKLEQERAKNNVQKQDWRMGEEPIEIKSGLDFDSAQHIVEEFNLIGALARLRKES